MQGYAMLSLSGKRSVADAMIEKGKAFVAASVLLRQNSSAEPWTYVSLHCFCQGLELFLKGVLLSSDYNLHKDKLEKIGHNLESAVKEVMKELKLKPLAPAVQKELIALNSYYQKHLLRYGGSINLLIDPASISYSLVAEKLLRALRVHERKKVRSSKQLLAQINSAP